MSELLGRTIADLIATMKERRVRIPSEIGAYIALEVCEALLDGPASVRPADVRVAEDGAISVFAPPGSATSDEAARSVVTLLGSLLVAAGTGVPRVLVGLLEEGPTSGRWDLASLRDDLEASLVPLNRSAARRVLARMLREVRRTRSSRPRSTPSKASAPGEPTLDDQLDSLLGGDAMPNEPAPTPAAAADAELDATLADFDGSLASSYGASAAGSGQVSAADRTIAEDPPAHAHGQRKHRSDAPTAPVSPAPKALPSEEPTSGPSVGIDLEALGAELEPKRSALPWLLAFVAILAATVAGLALLRPDLVDAMLGRPPPPEEPAGPTDEDRERMMREHLARFGTLTIEANPPESQILLFIGRGPAEASELPLGVAHELVAIADGRVPTRAFIPADATWEEVEGGHRYELALQTGSDEMLEADLDLGPTTLLRDALGSPSAVLGTVRVITSPPGARVYLLVGFSPRVVLENVRTDEVVELLVYHEGHPVDSTAIRPSAWTENADGSKHAEVSVTLEGYEPEE